MVKVVAKKHVNEGKLDEVIELYKELVEASRREEGCIKYELYRDEKDALTVAVIEEWENKDALNKHSKSEHFTRIVPMIAELTSKVGTDVYNKLI